MTGARPASACSGSVGLILFSLIGVRLWFLQTVKADELQQLSTSPRTRTVQIPPERGRIFDVDGRILADNQRVLTVAVDWQQLRKQTDRLEIFRRLSAWVDVPIEDMEDALRGAASTARSCRCRSSRGSTSRPRRRCSNAPRTSPACTSSPSGGACTRTRRTPPTSSATWARSPRTSGTTSSRTAGYLLNERVGQFGVEKSMEAVLHGTWGKQVYEVDAANRPVRLIEDIPPINGFDIQLTIDLDYQQYAEQALETTLKARRTQLAPNPKIRKPNGTTREDGRRRCPTRCTTRPRPASEVIMDYTDGSIIAMASYPTFDNRWFEAGLSSDEVPARSSRPRTRTATPIDPDQSILVNRAVQGRYNLGSTFKPFTAFAALNTGLMSAGDYYHDNGTYTLTASRSTTTDVSAGLVRCEYKNATCAGTQQPCRYGWRQRRGRAGRVVRRVLLPHRRADHGPQRLQAGAAGAGPTVRVRLRHRRRAAVRVRRHRARPGAEGASTPTSA